MFSMLKLNKTNVGLAMSSWVWQFLHPILHIHLLYSMQYNFQPVTSIGVKSKTNLVDFWARVRHYLGIYKPVRKTTFRLIGKRGIARTRNKISDIRTNNPPKATNSQRFCFDQQPTGNTGMTRNQTTINHKGQLEQKSSNQLETLE